MTRADSARAVTKLTGYTINEDALRRWEEQGALPYRGPGAEATGYDVWDIARACCVATLRLGPANMGPEGVRVCLAGLDELRPMVEGRSVSRIVATPTGAKALNADTELAAERLADGEPAFLYLLPIRSFMLGLRFEEETLS